jgi:glyoxylase-like metal-dependent hydrolase (beta-lactamase superfamily II)
MSIHITATAAALLLTLAGSPHSGDDAKNGTQPGAMQVTMVKTGLFMISGGGSNTVVRLTGAGPIVVDGKSSGQFALLSKKIHRVSEQPVRMLITTDHHDDRTGNNAQFIAAGVEVVAHENAKQNLIAEHRSDGAAALPTSTYQHGFIQEVGGIQFRVMNFGYAHTNGDTVVYFPNLKVVALGDLYAAAPEPDLSAGGNLAGWSRTLAEVLKLDFDVAVPAKGPTISKAELETFKARIDTLIAQSTTPDQRIASQ